MDDHNRSVRAWVRDIAVAYAGGLVLGAPFALLAVWTTGIERLATVAMLVSMAAVLHGLRRAGGRYRDAGTPRSAAPAHAGEGRHAA